MDSKRNERVLCGAIMVASAEMAARQGHGLSISSASFVADDEVDVLVGHQIGNVLVGHTQRDRLRNLNGGRGRVICKEGSTLSVCTIPTTNNDDEIHSNKSKNTH